MATERLDIVINGKDRTRGMFGKLSKGVRGLRGSLGGLQTAFAGAFAVIGGGAFLKNSLDKFAEQERAVESLRQALNDAGDDGAKSLPKFAAFASGLQSVTTQGDEATITLASYLSTLGDLSGDGLIEATKATLGLAQATGQGAEQIGRAYLNALQGNTSMLERYIPKLREAKNQADAMAMVNEFAQKGLNQMGTEAQTTGGKMTQLMNAIGDTQEIIGSGLAPVLSRVAKLLTDSAPDIQDWAEDFSEGAILASNSWGGAAEGINLSFGSMGDSANFYASSIAESFANAFDKIGRDARVFAAELATDTFADIQSDPDSWLSKIKAGVLGVDTSVLKQSNAIQARADAAGVSSGPGLERTIRDAGLAAQTNELNSDSFLFGFNMTEANKKLREFREATEANIKADKERRDAERAQNKKVASDALNLFGNQSGGAAGGSDAAGRRAASGGRLGNPDVTAESGRFLTGVRQAGRDSSMLSELRKIVKSGADNMRIAKDMLGELSGIRDTIASGVPLAPAEFN